MEFRFNINEIFKEPIVEINNSLIPPGFTGDKRTLWDTQSKISQVVNAMGEASAAAQGLNKPITTAERLRNSEHTVYLLVDKDENNGKGAVIGMLKTGEKGLYVFDREGQHYQVTPTCVLDFYVHESRQRTGLGKKLFEHMLQKEQVEPVKMAIDRPSDKFLGFLNKHYNLNSPVKQMNNFVVFDEFFGKPQEKSGYGEISHTPNKQSANGLQHFSSPYGRYAAHKPPCSMGQIIHNDSPVVNNSHQKPVGDKTAIRNGSDTDTQKIDRPSTLPIQPDGQAQETNDINDVNDALQTAEDAGDSIEEKMHDSLDSIEKEVEKLDVQVEQSERKTPEHAVTPEPKSGKHTPNQLTDKGYFDLKFYHNKLW